jgi:sugar lactone lactonase YvrE
MKKTKYVQKLIGFALVWVAALTLAPLARGVDAVMTVAGTVQMPGSTDGPAASALFNDPSGLAMDTAGNLYVADNLNHTIRKLATNGIVSTFAGQAGTEGSANGTGTNAMFTNPSGIVISTGGTLYVTDTGNHTIRAITSSGTVSTLAGQAGTAGYTNGTGAAAMFNSPIGIALDQSGNLYVADGGNHVIRKVTAAGVVTTLAGTPEVWGSVDGTGTNAQFNSPAGVAVDAQGNVFVSDSNNHCVRKVTAAGLVTTFAGSPVNDGVADGTGTNAQFGKPAELKIDPNGNLFLVDAFRHTVRMITTNAVVTTLAGLGGSSGSSDGLGSAARFLNPYGLAIDHNHNLRVSDTYNETIRLVYVPMVVTLAQAGNNISVQWQAVAGNKYQAQYVDALEGGAWQNLGAVVIATNTLASAVDIAPANSRRFYRVMLVP